MKVKGFTLVEVLIAMMLLSFVVYIGSLSFSMFSERWQRELGGFNADVADARKLLLLRQSLHGAANYLLRDNNDYFVYFFQGDSQQLSFVTNYAIFNTSQQALVRLVVKTLENGEQQLIYQESSFAVVPFLSVASAELPETAKTMLLLQSENIRFNYFGWTELAARDDYMESSTGGPVWQTEFNAASTGMLPYAVNLTWAQNEPVVIPIRNDNRFKTVYVTQDN